MVAMTWERLMERRREAGRRLLLRLPRQVGSRFRFAFSYFAFDFQYLQVFCSLPVSGIPFLPSYDCMTTWPVETGRRIVEGPPGRDGWIVGETRGMVGCQ